jgi:catechol 2,3-dioxygenase-like lactoylglutathione lyase family enzyme
MIGYVTLGTNDVNKAGQFYDSLFSVIGAKRGMESERFVMWSVSPTTPGVAIIKPYDGKAATVGNGAMVALTVDSRAKVDALYKKALELGGKDEGAPGERSPTFYAAYFRDLEGNKLAVFKAG